MAGKKEPGKHPGGALLDGKYLYKEIEDHFNSADDFKTEKELCDYIELNIKAFCEDIGIHYQNHARETYITKIKRFGANKPKIDFLVKDKQGKKTLIEVKNPKNLQREINRSIAQMLDYYIIAEENGHEIDKAYIVTTKCNPSFIKIVQRFNLPIGLILISKSKLAVWDKENLRKVM